MTAFIMQSGPFQNITYWVDLSITKFFIFYQFINWVANNAGIVVRVLIVNKFKKLFKYCESKEQKMRKREGISMFYF